MIQAIRDDVTLEQSEVFRIRLKRNDACALGEQPCIDRIKPHMRADIEERAARFEQIAQNRPGKRLVVFAAVPEQLEAQIVFVDLTEFEATAGKIDCDHLLSE